MIVPLRSSSNGIGMRRGGVLGSNSNMVKTLTYKQKKVQNDCIHKLQQSKVVLFF